jgi:hypothetical protein
MFDLAALVVAVIAGFVVYRSAFPSEYKHPATSLLSGKLSTTKAALTIAAFVLTTNNTAVWR